MSTRPTVPQHVIDRQREASDPTSSAWVSANAGSGKTHVLTQRVIRLLLSGVDPSKILCLTFTKAAAANMATRVFDTLAKWTSLDDDALAKDIAAMEGRRPDARRLLRARRLFAEALETPGGLKVQTIHAFCTALLHQFPFEADVAARFDVMDDRATAELIDRLRLDVLQEAADRPDTPLGKALAQAIVSAADVTFADVVREAVADGDALRAWVDGAEGLEPALRQLSFALGAGPDDTPESIGELVFGEAHLPPGLWPSLIAALDETGGNATYQSARLRRALMESGQTRLDSYLEIFFSEDATLKLMTPRKNVVAKKFRDEYPDLGARIDAEQERLVPLYDRLRAVRLRDRTAALVRIAHEVLARYAREKDRAGLLDYDDLIDRTLKLLARGGSEWVMYKLDLGIDHVLIDEAQDTSPKQWEVVEHLTAEFTAGAGARAGTVRSIFAVGDEKQSIYSFQGAVPLRFGEMRSHFETRHRQSDLAFARVDFLYSFRSSPDVLGAVDEVFAQPNAYSGLSADNVRTVHEAVRSTAPGSVELWPLVEPEDRREVLAWDRPFDATSEHHPRARLAQRIAATIREWIARGEPVVATGKPMQPGDVLILVRQRGQLFEAIIRALKDAGVDVAGADRLVLTEHIAVMDLMSLAEALLLPDNDLALAEALKSPLFGFDDDQLFALAHGRGSSLRRALARKAADDPRFAETAARLDELATAAQRETPFAFFARLLGPQGGRRRFLARLGPEAADALDEFLALALEYERQHVASLQGFIGWLRITPPEIKRDMDIVRNEVRVMTVHGAKGLEAPVVFLADTTTRPEGPRDPAILALDERPGAPLVWTSARKFDTPGVAQARAATRGKAQDEYRRLLYVAMTRAQDRLVVCGAKGDQKIPEGCWYTLIESALKPGAVETTPLVGDGTISIWRKTHRDEQFTLLRTDETAPAQMSESVPDWLARPAPIRVAPRLLRPSSAGGETHPRPARARLRAAGEPDALKRGTLMHRLLEALPDVPAARRADAARAYLGRVKPPVGDEIAERIIAEVTDLLNHPGFAPLFAAGSRAEVPIVGRIAATDGRPLVVSGQVDRLAVGDAVLIGDFKTDRAVPRDAAAVPAGYVAQLSVYRAVLSRLYPNRPVRAAILFTAAPRLIELPQELLDETLAAILAGRLDPPDPHT